MKKGIRNFLVLGTLTTIAIYGINKAISITSTMKNLLKTDRGLFFNWKYGKIYYTKSGKGSPIVLLHDLDPASSMVEWEATIKNLSKQHTVYALDLLGCGRSDKPNLTYTNYLYVQLLTDFIKQVVEEPCDVIATGGSGSFSIMTCKMEPDQIHKLILVNPEPLGKLAQTPDKKKNIFKFLIDMPIFGTFIYNIVYSTPMLSGLFTDKNYVNLDELDEKTISYYYESAHLGNSNGKYLLSSKKASYTNINIVHALENIDHSIYLICSKENANSEEVIESYCEFNPSIESAYIYNSKYLPQLEEPKAFLQNVNLFLQNPN